MFDFVEPYDGPVIIGLEKFETIYAKDQPQYRPLRTLPSEHGNGAIARFSLTDAQRKAISEGADIYLELIHFTGPLAPSRIMVMSEPADTHNFRLWWKAQTNGSYQIVDTRKTAPTSVLSSEDGFSDAYPHFGTPRKESSNVAGVGHDGNGNLLVKFHDGKIYIWTGLAAEHHDALLNADSPGSYIHKQLPKGKPFTE